MSDSSSSKTGTGTASTTSVFLLIAIHVYFLKVKDIDCDDVGLTKDPDNADKIIYHIQMSYGLIITFFVAFIFTYIGTSVKNTYIVCFGIMIGQVVLVLYILIFMADFHLWNNFDERYMCHEFANGIFHFIVACWYTFDIIFAIMIGVLALLGCCFLFQKRSEEPIANDLPC